MNKSIGAWLLHFNRNPQKIEAKTARVKVKIQYKDFLPPEEIDDFSIGDGSSFLLTFLGGGTLMIDLPFVKEIAFESLVEFSKGIDRSIPVYHLKVSLKNGRLLEGYSADLHSFSGRRSGAGWERCFKGNSPEQVAAQKSLARIIIRDAIQP